MRQISREEFLEFQQRRDELLRECQHLLVLVSRRPYCLKLLIGVRKMLQGFLAYKNPRYSQQLRKVS